jgi:TRAP-type C4-dicarboxylate transport system permease small subunit
MSGRRIVLNVLMAAALVTLLVFSYSYVNQPRFGYTLYAVFSGETTYNTIGFIDAIFFYVVGPVSSELIAFVVSYNLNQQSQTHSATSAKQGINLFVIMIILQIATVLIIALTATNVLKYEFGFIVSCLMAIAAGIAVSYTTPAKK